MGQNSPLTGPEWPAPLVALFQALPPLLDRTGDLPLAEQIARGYRAAILEGRLRPGQRLPPIRELAGAIGVARGVVQDAYRRLGEAGLVQSVVGRGTTVVGENEVTRVSSLSVCAEAAQREMHEMAGATSVPVGAEPVADFAVFAPDAEGVPVEELRSALDGVLTERGSELLGYAHAAAGLPELRQLLARLSGSGEPRASADDFVVTAGAQQALDLVLRTFCMAGDAVVVTSPSYHQMNGLLKAHGLQAIAVPWREEGLDLDVLAAALLRRDVRLCYLMPTFHNPTGRTLDRQSRERIAAILAATRVPLVEDEYQHALRFRGEQPPSLRELDPRGLTVTVSTFSKGLFPGLRVGWVQGSPEVLAPLTAVKRFVDLETSPLLQAALVEFAARGALDRSLQATRRELAQRHQALQSALRAAMPAGVRWTEPEGGYLSWLELPEPGQGDRLAELAALRGVRTVPGCAFEADGRPSRGLRLSVSRAPLDRIGPGVAILASCARELLQPAPRASLFL